jgi:hypothetical protein
MHIFGVIVPSMIFAAAAQKIRAVAAQISRPSA